MENIKKMIDVYLKKIESGINTEFKKIIEETKKHSKWYKEGRCYKCGGKVTSNEDKGIWSDYSCMVCGKSLYTDAPHSYYFESIIKKIIELEI